MNTIIDLSSVLQDAFEVLSEKEKEIIAKRFALEGQKKHTLEQIGQKFAITRERVRQIEKIALGKLNRTAGNTKIQTICNLANDVLQASGGAMVEDDLVATILNKIGTQGNMDGNIIRLALSIDPRFAAVKHSDTLEAGWSLDSVKLDTIKKVISGAKAELKKKKDVLSEARLVNDILASLGKKIEITPALVINSFKFSKELKHTEEGYGLTAWRHINPKSIRDKALIVLRREKKPLHFIDIANKIIESKFDKKTTTQQAVHNELIRYDEFVLVGRGLYALREWGYSDGTVADVIEDLLTKAKKPLTKQEIVEGVMAVRDVKVETISLNLQKNAHFARIGCAVYDLDLSKKK